MSIVAAVLVAASAAASPPAGGESPLFPFLVSYDAPENATNVSAWLERPAGKHGIVTAANGHLATAAGPLRLWATNLCFEACFPTRQQAERLAARLARLGINCVRMHHMDNRSIWGQSRNKLEIDPERMERLDYLISQLKRHGIYTNINLHVSRALGPKEGFVGEEGRPKYDKGVDNFEPRMIAMQKKYARDLLTHTNPHLGTAYTDEPAIAMVEINNENGLLQQWNTGGLDALPEPYSGTFHQFWNDWLKNKYGSTARLRMAWNAAERPLGGQMLRGTGTGAWRVQRDAQSDVDFTSPSKEQGPLRLVVRRMGEVDYIPQVSHSGLTVKKNEPYTLAFRIRAGQATTVSVNCTMDHEPWQRLGLSAKLDVGKEWQQIEKVFVATADDARARITFGNFQPGTFEIDQVSLRPGGVVGLVGGQSLEDSTVPIVTHEALNLTEQARHDFVDFLWETERRYWLEMYRFLKDELRVKQPIAGTQPPYSTPHLQAALDYVDAHSYWNHPSFPNKPWDPSDWYVRNLALVDNPVHGTLTGLAARRVVGKAYTVSEYNHPAPNFYAAEGLPMLAAYGAFQGWDGIFSFTYSHSDDYEPAAVTSYFDIKADPGKLVHHPACAAMFLRGDVAVARQGVRTPLPLDMERSRLRELLTTRAVTADQVGLNPEDALAHAAGLDLSRAAPIANGLPAGATAASQPAAGRQFMSDTGQLIWHTGQPKSGYFIANTPRTKFFTGFVRNKSFNMGDVGLAIGDTRLGWATVSIVALDGKDIPNSARVLIAATGWIQNSGAAVRDLGSDRITLGRQWGEPPILCEGVAATITLPLPASRVHLYPLDGSGARRGEIPVRQSGGQALLSLGPEHRTLWYEATLGGG